MSLSYGQGNDYQPELSYRGFSASPLLGAPQGLSVFVDGVRANEAFGDAVNWDLLPPNAISTLHLVPGSNPAFGLNTLGAALAVNTKSGFQFPGSSGRAFAGSYGRIGLQAEQGGHGERADYFVAAQALNDDGRREHAPSRLRQLFGKTGWQDERSDIDVTFALADNALQGAQALPLSMLGSRRSAYTWPDRNDNSASLLSVRASRFLSPDVLLAGNAYARSIETANLSSNVNDGFDPALPVGPGNSPGSNARSGIRQRTQGASVQMTVDTMPGQRRNQLTFGAAVDEGRVSYRQETQEAVFTGEREALGGGAFRLATEARTFNRYWGIYAADNYAFAQGWNLVGSGRYNVAQLHIRDASGAAPRLDGDHVFRRFNPALGITANVIEGSTFYANANQGMRAPTPMELTCADPAAPCALPNAFLADPPLRPVIARTVEAGWRARSGERWSASLGVYRTVLYDDIQFVASGGTVNSGFFQNVGRSGRQGFESSAARSFRRLRLSASYTRIDARFLGDFPLHSPSNSLADANGDIRVRRGDRIPGIPADALKLRADWEAGERWLLSATLLRFGPQYARGDENNADAGGRLPAYRVVNAEASQPLGGGWSLLARVDNVFDSRFETFGVLGQNFFRGPGGSFDAGAAAPEQFRTPGAPRSAWVYVSYAFK